MYLTPEMPLLLCLSYPNPTLYMQELGLDKKYLHVAFFCGILLTTVEKLVSEPIKTSMCTESRPTTGSLMGPARTVKQEAY